MGYTGLKALDAVHHTHSKTFRTNYAVDPFLEFPAFVDTGTALVDKYNVDLYWSGAIAGGQQ